MAARKRALFKQSQTNANAAAPTTKEFGLKTQARPQDPRYTVVGNSRTEHAPDLFDGPNGDGINSLRMRSAAEDNPEGRGGLSSQETPTVTSFVMGNFVPSGELLNA